MFTQAPEITIDATVGQVIVQPTATPTSAPSTSSATSTPTSSTSTPLPVSTPTSKPIPTIAPERRYKQNALIIYGYGPSNADVSLKGFGVSEKTTSDEDGLFVFGGIYSFTYTYPELCVQATDSESRVTQPSCIPALPNNSLIPLEVGPILLSPTISISKNNIKTGDESVLTGKTIPNSNVNIFLSKKEKSSLSNFSLVSEAKAYTLPTLNIKADENGEYSLTLPTNESAEYKIFASSKYGEDLSNKSNTLNFVVLTRLKTFLENLIELILKNKFLTLVFLEVLVFIFLFLMALKSTTKSKKVHTEKDYLKFVSEYK